MKPDREPQLRSGVRLILVMATLAALLPWFSGGQDLVAQVISLVLLLLASLLAWRQPHLPLVDRRLTAVGLGLLAWGALSLVWTANRYDTVLWLLPLVAAMAAFVLSYRLTQLPGGRRTLTLGYLMVLAIFAVYGIYLYLTGDYERLTSSIYWANPAAAFLIPGVMLAWDRAARTGQRWLFQPIALLLLIAFWLTDSRGGSLVLVMTTVLFLAYKRPPLRYWINFVFIGLISFGLSIGFAQARGHLFHSGVVITPGSRLSEAAKGESISGSDRIEYLKSAVAIWRDHPVVGTGAGTFGVVHPRYQNRVIAAATDAHNWYIQVLAELGLVGALLLLVLVGMILQGVWRGLRAQPALLPWAAGIVALLMHFGLDIDAHYPALLALLAVWVGMVWRPAGRERWGRASLALPIGLVMAVILVAAANSSQLAQAQGRAAQTDGNYQTAAADFYQAHQTLVYDPATLNAEAINLYTLATLGTDPQTNLALALDRARSAERLAPLDSQNYQLEGRVLSARGDVKGAEAAFRRALVLDPYNQPQYAFDLAQLMQSSGRSAEALRVTRQMVGQYPASVLANRHNDPAIGRAIVNVELLQARLEEAQGDKAGALRDLKAAQGLYKSLPSS